MTILLNDEQWSCGRIQEDSWIDDLGIIGVIIGWCLLHGRTEALSAGDEFPERWWLPDVFYAYLICS